MHPDLHLRLHNQRANRAAAAHRHVHRAAAHRPRPSVDGPLQRIVARVVPGRARTVTP